MNVFLPGDAALFHELLDEGLVFGDLHRQAVSDEVGATVANLGHVGLRMADPDDRAGCAHTGEFLPVGGELHQMPVGLFDGLLQHLGAVGERASGQDVPDNSDTLPAGQIALGMTANTVCHHCQKTAAACVGIVLQALNEKCVFVDLADMAPVALAEGLKGQHGSVYRRRNLSTAEPI